MHCSCAGVQAWTGKNSCSTPFNRTLSKKIKIRPSQQFKNERAYPLVNYLKLQAFSRSNLPRRFDLLPPVVPRPPARGGLLFAAKLMETRRESVPRTGAASPWATD